MHTPGELNRMTGAMPPPEAVAVSVAMPLLNVVWLFAPDHGLDAVKSMDAAEANEDADRAATAIRRGNRRRKKVMVIYPKLMIAE
ncbi:MAG: hypothetical protein IPM01_08375 [Burkholderiaceae bacterium]|nr:hypothetical protein [Burkholderiaceae bacterium]